MYRKDDYQLILIDARGHRESDKPHQPEAYDHRLLVDNVIAVLDDLPVSQTDYLGYSMGGMIGFGLAKYYPNRLKSLIAGGVSPYNRDEPTVRDKLLEMYEVAAEQGNEALIAQIKAWAGSITPALNPRMHIAL